MAYNLENLFHSVGKWDYDEDGEYVQIGEIDEKPKEMRRWQGRIIHETAIDLGVFEEVESLKALSHFDRHYLGSTYHRHLLEGNDPRGIDIGFLSKRDLPFEIEHRTNKGLRYDDPISERNIAQFSRDLPILILRLPGEKTPFLIFIGTHFKSKRDRPDDPQSNSLRESQVIAAAQIVEDLKIEFGKNAPIVMAGDMNGNVNTEAEFAVFRAQLALVDSLNLVKPKLSEAERVTQTWHPTKRKNVYSQLDAILLSPVLVACFKSAGVYRYKDERGLPKPLPKSRDERDTNPSDHYPVLLQLDMRCLLDLWQKARTPFL